jgi:hypothetical protein
MSYIRKAILTIEIERLLQMPTFGGLLIYEIYKRRFQIVEIKREFSDNSEIERRKSTLKTLK